MQQNTKLAPYFKAQSKQCDRLSDWLILVGEGAYYAYFDRKKQAGKGEQWQLIRDAYQFSTDRQPVILDSKSFAEIDRLFLAPTEQAFIKIFQVGEIPTLSEGNDLKSRILLNLSKHNPNVKAVEWLDVSLQSENLTPHLERIRSGESVITEVPEATISEEQRKTEFTKLFDTLGDNEKLSAFMAWYKKPIYYHEQLNALYHYTGQKWELVEDVTMGRLIRNFFLDYGITKYNANRIEKMLNLFKYEAERMGKRDPNLLAFANGILHKQTGEFMPHAKEYFLTSFINIDYYSTATPTPNFDKWLNWVSDGNEPKKMRILAALYMILTNRYEWQLFLEITGEGGTGKSIFNHLAKILAGGDDNTTALSLKDLESPTMRCGLIDKTLCYSPDQESYISDGGILRSITGGDSISFRPLYKGAFKDTVKAIFLITGNSPIIFKEQKGGTSRRRVIFQFNKVVSESEKDYHLKDKLEQEAGGIVRLLLDTFPNAMISKQLLEEQKASEEALEVKEEHDHILQFAKHFKATEIINGLTLGSSRKEGAHRTALHSSYLYFCDRMGIINPLQRNRFRQAFEHALKERRSDQPLRTRIKDGINVTNIYYIDMMNTLRDWDS